MNIKLNKLQLINFNHFENKTVDFESIDVLDDHLTIFGAFNWLLFENSICTNLNTKQVEDCKVSAVVDFFGSILTIDRVKVNSESKLFIENCEVSPMQFNEMIIQRLIGVSSEPTVYIPEVTKSIAKNCTIYEPEVVSKYFKRQAIYKIYMNSINIQHG